MRRNESGALSGAVTAFDGEGRRRSLGARPESRERVGLTLQEEMEALGLGIREGVGAVEGWPLALALRPDGHRGTIAVAAAEMVQIEIEPPGTGRDSCRAWEQVAHALASISDPIEVWQVLATRRRADAEGSALRFGWLGVGRAASAQEAAIEARRALVAVLAIQDSLVPFVRTRPVAGAEALLDLLRPASAPLLYGLRRQRWEPLLLVERGRNRGGAGDHLPGAYLRWSPTGVPWGPMVEAVASSSQHAALIVRLRTAVQAPEPVVREAEADALAIAREHGRLMGASLKEAAPLTTISEQLHDAAEARLELVRRRCLAVDATLATWSTESAGLRGIVASSLAGPAPRHGSGREGSEVKEPVRAPAIEAVPLPQGALWEPVELRVEALVDASEAWALLRTPEPPSDERSPLPASRSRALPLRAIGTSGAWIGDAERGAGSVEARVDEETRLKHIYVVGQTGTGKSTLLLRMVLDDVHAGHGVTVLDPHGTLISDILLRLPDERIGDVVLVDPSDVRYAVPFNPFVLNSDGEMYKRQRDRVLDEMLDTFDALYEMHIVGGPMFENYFRTFSTLVIGSQRPSDYVPLPLMLEIAMGSERVYRGLAERLDDSDDMARTALENILAVNPNLDQGLRNMLPYVTSKLVRFYAPLAARRMLCQPACLDLLDVIERRRILLVQLAPAHVGSEAAALLARQIILRLSIAAMTRGARAEVTPHFIYADECHNFTTERFAALLAEARKFRLGLVLAHQYTSQLVKKQDTRVLDAVLGNVGTVIAFRVGAMDADLLQRVMAPRARSEDLAGLRNFTAIARSAGSLGNIPFTLRTRPAPPKVRDDVRLLRDAGLAVEGVPSGQVDRDIAQEVRVLRQIR